MSFVCFNPQGASCQKPVRFTGCFLKVANFVALHQSCAGRVRSRTSHPTAANLLRRPNENHEVRMHNFNTRPQLLTRLLSRTEHTCHRTAHSSEHDNIEALRRGVLPVRLMRIRRLKNTLCILLTLHRHSLYLTPIRYSGNARQGNE